MNDRLQKVVWDYLQALVLFGRGSDGKRTDYVYFIDAGILRGDYSNMFSEPMLIWHLETATWVRRRFKASRRRYIRRVVPILDKQHSLDEICLIKFTLNIQLALGSEVLLYFVEDPDFLERVYGVDNTAVVKRGVVVDVLRPYDATAPYDVRVSDKKSEVADRYLSLDDLSKDADNGFLLRYDTHTFTSHRTERLHRKYAGFLYRLQSGRCAITSEPLANWPSHVDHIYPLGQGGNNSLVNLQLTLEKPNLDKAELLQEPRFCFTPQQMQEHGFDTTIHERFSDRSLKGISIGPESLLQKNPYA